MLAEILYTIPADNKMIIEPTEVKDELRGKGIGNQLVHAAVDYGRSHQIKIISQCRFASVVFKKKPEYADVL